MESRNSIFYDLPKVQQIEILVEWLDFYDVVRLDVATCNHKFREEYMSCFLNPQCIFSVKRCYLTEDTDGCQWIVDRKAKFSSIHFDQLILTNITKRESVLRCVGSTVKKLYLDFEDSDDEGAANELHFSTALIFNDVLRYCPILENLEILWCSLVGSFADLILRSTCLHTLSILQCDLISASMMEACASSTTLQDISLHLCSFVPGAMDFPLQSNTVCRKLRLYNFAIFDTDLVKFCSNFSRLTSITMLLRTPSLLATIALNCRYVEKCVITLADTMTHATAFTVADNWPQLQHLQINNTAKKFTTVGANVMTVFITKCLRLKQLQLAQRKDPSDSDDSYEPTRNPTNMLSMSCLTELAVSSLTEAELLFVVQHCPHLTRLSIRRDRMPGQAFQPTDRAECYLHHLKQSPIQVLRLINCPSVEGRHLCGLSTLTALQIAHVGDALSDTGLLTALRDCPELTTLTMKGCVNLSHDIVLPALDLCHKLRTFSYSTAESEKKNLDAENTPVDDMLSTVVKRLYPNLKDFSVRC